jgi:hypothetical protein
MSSNMNALQEVEGSYNDIKRQYHNLIFMNPEHPDKRIEIIDIVEQLIFLKRFMKSHIQMYWTKRPYRSIDNWIVEIVNRFRIERYEISSNYVQEYDEVMWRGPRSTSMFRANNAFQPSIKSYPSNTAMDNLNPRNPTPPRSPKYNTLRPAEIQIYGGKKTRRTKRTKRRNSRRRQ